MKIGCVKEIKNNEFRVGMTPDSVNEYVEAGHQVYIESMAGLGSSITDADYLAAGATILPSAIDIWNSADMIIKVKEPLEQEYDMMREGQIIFTYFHFAASESLTRACLKKKVTAVAYETVKDSRGGLPLLKPMSEIAGCMAPIVGSYFLMKAQGGYGILPTGVPGVKPANVVVLGGGIVGKNAARVAAGLGCIVTLFDTNIQVLTDLKAIMPANVFTEFSNGKAISKALLSADMVIGAVLIPGAKAPKLVTYKHLSTMKRGAVIVDVAIDQGGCFESSHPTTHDNPIFEKEGVLHYCVANMPGSFSRTATISLCNATLAYGLEIANLGIVKACQSSNSIKSGVNMFNGYITYAAVANAFGLMSLYKDPSVIYS